MRTKEFKSGSRPGIGVGKTPQNNSSKNNTYLCKFAVMYLAVRRGGSDSLGNFYLTLRLRDFLIRDTV